MTKIRTRALLGAIFTGAIVAANIIHAPLARADVHSIRSLVVWTGPRLCLAVAAPTEADRYHVAVYTLCSSLGVSDVYYNAIPGQYVGADPIIQGQYSVGCSLYVDGALNYADFAAEGDGTDVNCLRVLTENATRKSVNV